MNKETQKELTFSRVKTMVNESIAFGGTTEDLCSYMLENHLLIQNVNEFVNDFGSMEVNRDATKAFIERNASIYALASDLISSVESNRVAIFRKSSLAIGLSEGHINALLVKKGLMEKEVRVSNTPNLETLRDQVDTERSSVAKELSTIDIASVNFNGYLTLNESFTSALKRVELGVHEFMLGGCDRVIFTVEVKEVKVGFHTSTLYREYNVVSGENEFTLLF